MKKKMIRNPLTKFDLPKDETELLTKFSNNASETFELQAKMLQLSGSVQDSVRKVIYAHFRACCIGWVASIVMDKLIPEDPERMAPIVVRLFDRMMDNLHDEIDRLHQEQVRQN